MTKDVSELIGLDADQFMQIILLAAAVPTAYTGASGIFVIAAGGIIYHEVRASGGTRQFALAATAMSGSLGVVLRPCLLVVLIAALNKQVTTNGLYHWGFYVFLLTSTLFFLASQMLRTQRANIESFSVAEMCVPAAATSGVGAGAGAGAGAAECRRARRARRSAGTCRRHRASSLAW